MSIVACPRCRDEVTLPPKLSPQARVRCPLCRDEYILSEALAAMPPALIVLDPGPDAEVTGYAEPEYKVAGEAGSGMAPDRVFDTTGPMGDAGVATAPRPAMKGTRPRKKKEGSAIGMMIQVVLGGVGAFLLVNPFCWWVIKEDTFGTAAFVHKIFPAIVPEHISKKFPVTKTDDGKNDQASNTSTTPKTGNGKKNNGTGKPGNNAVAADPNAAKPILDPDVGPIPEIPPEPGEIKIDDPTKLPPVTPLPEKPVDFTPPMPKPLDPNAKAPVNATELRIPYTMAVAKREAFDQADTASQRQAGKEMFEAGADLGRLTADADLTEKDSEDIASQIKEYSLLMTGKLKFVNFFALERLLAKEGEEGIVIGGKLTDFKSIGSMYEATVEVPQKTTPLAVVIVTPKNLQASGAKIGDTAVVLGRIIRDPKKDLPSYGGEAPQVIQAGHTTVVPAE